MEPLIRMKKSKRRIRIPRAPSLLLLLLLLLLLVAAAVVTLSPWASAAPSLALVRA
jgi:hypothetical protein